MTQNLTQLIDDFDLKHGTSHGHGTEQADNGPTAADYNELQRRIYNMAMQWSDDEIARQKAIMKGMQQDDPDNQTRAAVIAGLQQAANVKATGQGGQN